MHNIVTQSQRLSFLQKGYSASGFLEVSMISVKRIFLMLMLLPASSISYAVSLGEVHHQVKVITSHLNTIKKHSAADKQSRTISVQVGKTSLHAYVKALDLLEKIRKYQAEKGLALVEIPSLPLKKVRSKHLMKVVQLTLQEVEKLSQALNLTVEPIEVDDKSKTASDLYGQIWQASYLMDTLVSPVNMADVKRNNLKIAQGLKDIAKRLDKEITAQTVPTFKGKQATDVTIGLYKLLYKLADLERKLKLKPLVVPNFPTGDIQAADAYEAGSSVVADLTRIALKLKIPPIKALDSEANEQTSSDMDSLYAQVHQLNVSAERLIK